MRHRQKRNKEETDLEIFEPPREEIMEFAVAMEKQMRYNEARGKSYAWVAFNPRVLYERMIGEVGELTDELAKEPNFNEPQFQHECMDVSTFGLFLWYQSKTRERNNGRE